MALSNNNFKLSFTEIKLTFNYEPENMKLHHIPANIVRIFS